MSIEVEEPWEDPRKTEYVTKLIECFLDQLTIKRLEEPTELNKLFQTNSQKLSKRYKFLLGKSEVNKYYQLLVQRGHIAPSFVIDSVTKTKSVRSSSGVLPISLATDGNNFSCAYDCFFCPDESVKKGASRDISRSYLSSEGTFIRGAIENFEPAGQVWRRLLELELMGHPPDKLEMILLGGTWDSYDPHYREYFLHQVFYACNVFARISLRTNGDLAHLTRQWAQLSPFRKGLKFDETGTIKEKLRPIRSFQEEKNENEHAECARIIGIVLETRPDQISKKSLLRKRRMGCTRIQLGLQHTDDSILRYNNRGHGVDKSISAIACARDACFKIDGHLMPDLPGTTYEKDINMIERVFGGDDLQLDYCKLYPCLDLPYTVTREWKKSGQWKPMAEHNFEQFLDVLRIACHRVPPWTRINRLHRDFPEATAKNEYLGFVSSNIRSNLQQYVTQELKRHNQGCYDIRSREIRNQFPDKYEERAKLFVRTYRANNGTEFFLSIEIPKYEAKCCDDAILMGLLRLRFTDYDVARLQGRVHKAPFHLLPEFAKRPLALVRELHVYGTIQMVVRNTGIANSQHTGVGKFLMAAAERIAKAYGYNELAVIAGVGVRSYYKKLGYAMDSGEGEYLVKEIRRRMLPLYLFGRQWMDDDIIFPIATMSIPQKHVRAKPDYSQLNCRRFLPTTPSWFILLNYPLIQHGAAELVIIDNVRRFSWWRSPIAAVVMLAVLLSSYYYYQ